MNRSLPHGISCIVSSRQPSIFEFDDYRRFLAAYFEQAKKRNPAWSYRAWAKTAGLKSNTSLIKVIQGQRHAGADILRKLENYFQLRDQELEYFRALVGFSKSEKNPEQKLFWGYRINQLARRKKFRILDDSAVSALSSWYALAIRDLMSLKDFVADPAWISKRFLFPLTPQQVTDAILALSRLKLIRRDELTGEWKPEREDPNTLDDVPSEALKKHHEAVLENAKLALRSVPPKDRQISGTVMPMRASQIDEVKKMVRQFEEDLERKFAVTDGTGDVLYQLEVALFPLTRRGRNS